MQTLQFTLILIFGLFYKPSFALLYQDQSPEADTVIMKIGDKSSIHIFIADKDDLKKLQQVDLNATVRKVGGYLDSTRTQSQVNYSIKDQTKELQENSNRQINAEKGNYNSIFGNRRRANWVFNFDFGLNNYLQNGLIPSDQSYGLDFVNSRYVAIGFGFRAWLVRGINLRMGSEIAWNNFMFRDDVRIRKTSEGVDFVKDNNTYDKSKLTTIMLNFPAMLQVALYDNFRIGIGANVGILLDSYSKVAYSNGGVEHEQSNFNLSNIRYGLRGEIGGRDIRFFVNYDMGNLFNKEKTQSPDLQAFSFGIRL